MSDKIKVSMLEINGVDLGLPTERLLTSDIIDHDPTGTDLTATDVKEALSQLAGQSFGKDFKSDTTINNDSTSGNSWATYATLVFNVSETSGTNKYRLNSDFLWGHSASSNDIRVRVTLDGNDEKELRIEPKDTGTDQRIQNNLLIYAEDLSVGNHTLVLQYRPSSSNKTSRMYRSELEVWRVE